MVLGSGTPDGSGKWVLTTSSLTTGSHSITAGYSGDATFNPSVSGATTQRVT
jgi:hypothetical protein